ncbi:MAG TPA: EAL domain-containing protein [Vicinamibacteria bacterium]|nr:EAL domain-containing protein [Vicinamibacteria bacterium]
MSEDARLANELRAVMDVLRQRDQQYRLLAEQAADGVLLLAADGKIADASPGAAALLGRPRAALLKLELGDIVEADKAVDTVAGLLVLPTRQRLTRAFRLRRPSQSPLEVEVSARRLNDGRLQLALRDTAERRRAADALHESEERYERLAASAPDAIAVEASGRVVFANLALRKLLGLQPAAAMAGRSLADFLHQDERLEVAKALAGAADAGGAGLRLSTRMRRADGSTAEVEGTATPVTYRGRPALQILLREVADDRVLVGDAYHDAMTGLTSPMLIPDRLSVAIAQAYRHRARVGVLHVDLDRLAAVNDRLGRPQGDRVLRAAARRLSHCVRVGDTAGRLDADAFVLILPGLHHGEDATRIADKVLRALRKPFPLSEETVSVTASVGVAIFPEDGEDAPALLASAEQSARRALEAGGNRAESGAPPPLDDGLDALELEAGLRAALGGGSMALNRRPPPAGVLHYQPIHGLPAKRIVGVEALLRWQHPQMGLVFPQSFLSKSDFTGLILAIGPWILRTAAVQVREWQASFRSLRLAVNLSPPELMKKTLPEEVKAALEETGFPPKLLQLEVPEGHVVSDLPRSIDALHRLKALGVSLVLDRFAVRYSSLGRLAELPLDGVKLDLAFLRGPSSNPEDVSLLTAVTAVARGLKLRVSAQGVETAGQLALLERLGCAEAQGFHLGPPVAPSILAEQLGARAARDGAEKR